MPAIVLCISLQCGVIDTVDHRIASSQTKALLLHQFLLSACAMVQQPFHIMSSSV